MSQSSPAGVAPRVPDLLAGTALALALAAAAEAQESRSATPADEPLEDEVLVLGRRGDALGDSSISKLTQPLVETPQSISTVPALELEARAVANLDEALRNVPGVTLGAGEFSWQGNSPTIRGFVARSDMFLDGMRDFGSYYRDPFNLEQLEILQGPSSIYFGRGSTGGVINQTSKRPQSEGFARLDAAVGTAETYRAVADVNQPLGESSAARVTAMAHRNEVAGRDAGEMSRWGVAPSLALGLGTPTRLQASYLHQAEDNVPDYGLPWYFGRPAPVDRENFYGYTDDHLDTQVDVGTVRIEHDLSPSVTIRDQLRYAAYSRDFRIAEPVLPAGATPATPLESIAVDLNMWSGEGEEAFLQNQLDVLARFETGGLAHTIVAGVEVGRESSAPTFRNTVPRPTKSLLDPDPSDPFPADAFTFLRLAADTEAETLAVFATDTIDLTPRWEASLGVRWDRFEADYRSSQIDGPLPTGPAELDYFDTQIVQADEAASWRAALVYKPVPAVNLYGAAGTSFNPSAEGLTQITSGRGLGTGNVDLDPEENRSFEVGAKIELRDSDLVLTGALFRLEKTNARVPDVTNPGFNMLGGEQRVDGVQVQLAGSPTDDLYVSAGYTYLDSEVTKSVSAPGAPPVGRPLINAPEHSASFLAEYRITPDLTAGLSGTYLAERLAQNAGATPLVAPSYATFDAMARYALGAHWAVQLNVFNLSDETYFDQIHAWHVVPGAGRSALLTVQMRY